MRYVAIGDAKPGMCLAYDLYDSMGRTIVGKGCELTDSYIARLNEYGFSGVYIDDELTKEIRLEASIPEQLRLEGIQSIQSSDIDQCVTIAGKIVDDILPRGTVSLDMLDLRSYDDYTYAHSVNVAVLCCAIGMGLEMSERDLNDLVTAALLHDLGKLFVPTEILHKPGHLTPEEYQIMKLHSTKSYELICDRTDISENVKQAVLGHHENYDGSGYPQGLRGEEQSLLVRVLHVADVYDALTARRPYKQSYSPYEAVEYLMGACGIMFDQSVVEVFLEYIPLFPKGSKVSLSDGRNAIICQNTSGHNLRPMVILEDGTKLDLMDNDNLNITILPPDNLDVVSPEEEEKGRKNMEGRQSRKTVMVVDDMVTNLDAMRSILEHTYAVVLCKSGEQALHYLERNKYPDLIIMDIDMPQMNGIEATARINQMTGEQVPVLFVSAVSDEKTVADCRALHAAGYILRPYKAVFIKSEVERIVNGWR